MNQNPNLILLMASIGSFLTPFMGSSVNVALPAIGREFRIGPSQLSWIALGFLVSVAVLLVPAGRMADIYGRKKIYQYGMLIYSISSILCAVAGSSITLLLFRILQGGGGAMIFGTGVAILTSVFPPGKRGRALGINVASVYLGITIGPFAGGFIVQHINWRAVFIINGIIGIIVFLIVLFKIKQEWKGLKSNRFNFTGSILYASVMVTGSTGFLVLPSKKSLFLILFSVCFMVLFFLHELKAPNSLFPLEMFLKNRVFAFSNLAAFINYTATFGVGFLLSLYLQDAGKMTAGQAGLLMTVQPVIMTLLSPFAGIVSDKIQPRFIASTGMFLTSVGLLSLSFIEQNVNISHIILSQIVLGSGLAFFSSPNTNCIMNSVPRDFHGIASATVGTMRVTGQMVSMAIVATIFSVYMGHSTVSSGEGLYIFIHCVKISFALFAIMCFVGVIASMARGKKEII